MNGLLILSAAIFCEIFSTSMLKLSSGFSKVYPSIGFVIGMILSFYALSKALTIIPLNVAYAIWAGAGTVITSIIAILIWKEKFNAYTVAGIILITIGVIILKFKGTVH